MTNLEIAYNPYRLTTTVLIDGKVPRRNSKLNFGERLLQEWVNDLPDILFDECRERDFKIKFKGTARDYEDIKTMVCAAKENNINIEIDYIPGKEAAEIETLLDEIFEEVNSGPLEEPKMYIKKYAETGNSKDIAHDVTVAFKEQLNNIQKCIEEGLEKNKKDKEKIIKGKENIEKAIADVGEAEELVLSIEQINYDREIKQLADDIVRKAWREFDVQCLYDKASVTNSEAIEICKTLLNRFDELQDDIHIEMEDMVTEYINTAVSNLLAEYKKKLSNVTQELSDCNISLEAFELTEEDIYDCVPQLIGKHTVLLREKRKIGEVWVDCPDDDKWYKPWDWGKGHKKDIYEYVEYVDLEKLSDELLDILRGQLSKSCNQAVAYARTQTAVIKESFHKKIVNIKNLRERKNQELETYINNLKDVEREISEAEAKLEWLGNIQAKIKGLLDI